MILFCYYVTSKLISYCTFSFFCLVLLHCIIKTAINARLAFALTLRVAFVFQALVKNILNNQSVCQMEVIEEKHIQGNGRSQWTQVEMREERRGRIGIDGGSG